MGVDLRRRSWSFIEQLHNLAQQREREGARKAEMMEREVCMYAGMMQRKLWRGENEDGKEISR